MTKVSINTVEQPPHLPEMAPVDCSVFSELKWLFRVPVFILLSRDLHSRRLNLIL